VVVDISTFPDAGIVEDLYMERLRAGKPVAPGHVERFRISPGAGTVTGERLIEESLDLPRINYGRCNERPYRHAWGIGFGGGWIDRIVKADVDERNSVVWAEDGCFPGEPVFVAAPDAEREDEGVLLSIVLDGDKGNSFLLVLDAGSLEELARAEVPHHIPFGFHGQFARA
jgi:carotenoid cleavage dioxygenase-like enzyme